MKERTSPELAPTGITGLDDILRGGYTAGKMHLLSGGPGTGKTTFSLHFIAEGVRRGERCLYISVGSAEKDFIALAKATGVVLSAELFSIHTVDLGKDALEGPEKRIFHAAETEPTDAMKEMLLA